jgi:predicted CoA-binding protein
MPHTNPTDDQLRQLLSTSPTIAIVGASGNAEKPSYDIMRRLQRKGFRVIPVNPRETEILGERAYASLADIPDHVDIVDVFRRPEDTPPIADEAAAIGARAFWLQKGIASEEAAERAARSGLVVIMDRCIGETTDRLISRPPVPAA